MELLEVPKKIKNESGKTYSDLYVVGYVGMSDGKTKHPKFLCKCSCGTEVVVTGTNLRSKHTKSCGHNKISKMHEGLRKYRENHVPSDLNGVRFGRLVVREFYGMVEGKNYTSSKWECICDCGEIVVRIRGNLTSESSCGCWTKEKIGDITRTHGMSKTPTYKSWMKMKERCDLDSYVEPEYYKDRGITYDPKWGTFEGFYEDMGERPEGMTLDRILPERGYEPSNCRWADLSTQSYNRRPLNNTSGRVGVHKQANGLYSVIIGVERKRIVVERDLTFEVACEVRKESEIKYYGFSKESY